MGGKVYLVGAGPGDPDLLTLKALRVLSEAEIVLHDALVSPEILDLIPTGAVVLNVGKRCGPKAITQSQINGLMVSFAAIGKVVVRLKCGDPLIFGRAAEEIEALRDAATEFEIVPGITAALSAAAVAGISLTERNVASSVVFATAHRADDSSLRWEELASSGSTIVFYMPGQHYSEISKRLVQAGLAADTPCAIVSRASAPGQRIQYGSLQTLPLARGFMAPSILLVGKALVPATGRDFTRNIGPSEYAPFEQVSGRSSSPSENLHQF